jgi:hypothetical protein
VKLAVRDFIILELPSVKLAVYHVEVLELQAGSDAVDLDRERHPLHLDLLCLWLWLRLSLASQLFTRLLLNKEHTQVLFHLRFTRLFLLFLLLLLDGFGFCFFLFLLVIILCLESLDLDHEGTNFEEMKLILNLVDGCLIARNLIENLID